ncbi:MAG: amidohydrolase family protein [Lachnospiraceae bacterium]
MKKIIKCGKLFDGQQEKYFEKTSILVEDGKIMKVGDSATWDVEAETIDLSDKVVTPGLMEIHNHNVAYNNQNVSAILREKLYNSRLYSMLGITYHLNKLLEKGFTLVRDCCSIERGWEIVDVRDAIRDGFIEGPEFVVCGHSGASVGSHLDTRQFVSNTISQENCTMPSIGSGVEFFRQWVRTEFLHHVDFIKIHIDGGFATPGDHPDQQHLTDAEIQVIIETAHDCGMKVTAHIYNEKSAKKAILMGVDGIEHGALITPDVYDLMAEKNVYLVPTMTFFDRGYFMDPEELAKVPSFMAKKYCDLHPRLVESRTALIKHIENDTILVGYGTDMGAVEPTLPVHKEFETMVRSGVSPFKALKIATSNSAKICQRPDLGVIAENMQADIVAWDEDPVQNVTALRECSFVMKKGRIVKHNHNIYKTI